MPERPLRVAFVDYVLEPERPGRSGLSDIVWEMAAALADQGHAPSVVAAYHTGERPDPRVPVHPIPEPPLAYRNVAGHLWLLRRAAAVIRRLRPDLVHAPEYVSTAVLAARGVPAPLVLTVPGNVFHRLRHGHSYEWHYLQVLKWAARLSARRCARVIAISRAMRHWWVVTGSAPARTPWIPLGVDTTRFAPLPGARAALGLPPDRLLLLAAGRLAAEKGLLDLVAALGSLRPLLPPERLTVALVGRGPQEAALRRAIGAAGLGEIVQLHPWLEPAALRAWYCAADALLLPSRSEALSRALLQALACGTPVIGTRISGTEDHVRDGVTGWLAPANDPRALAAVLRDVLADPARLRALRPGCVAYARQRLAWPVITGQVVREVYAPVLEETACRT